MTRILLLFGLFLVACGKSPPRNASSETPIPHGSMAVEPLDDRAQPRLEGPAEVPEELGAPSLDDLRTVIRLLSARDGDPDCREVMKQVPNADPVATWLYVIQTVQMPPTAPMRAAACLVDDHAEEASVHIQGWMSGEETAGLARLVLGRLAQLPEDLAVAVVTIALGSEMAEDARSAAGESKHPGVQALIEEMSTAE